MNKNRTLKLEYGPKLVSLFLILSLVLTGISSIVGAPVRASSNSEPDPTLDAPRIRLSVGEFDPLVAPEPAGLPDLLRLSAYPGDGTGYYLVQFQGPIAPSDVDALTRVGAEVFDYIPDFTFIVKMDSAMRAAVEKIGQVRWVGLYQPAYRLATDLSVYTSDDTPISDFPQPNDDRRTADPKVLWSNNPIEVVVTIFRDEELSPIRTQIETLGGVILDQSQTKWKSKLLVSISPSLLADLAAFPGVRWIEKAPEWKLTNSEAADIMGVREVWDTHGLYGAGQTIAVCDSGLDQGSTSPASLHDDFENGSGASRVLVVHDVASDGAPSDVNSGHGTHVAGSVLGNGDLSGATPGTHTYPDTAYVGMAPEASLVFQATEDNSSGNLVFPTDLNTLFAQAASSGADLHTNSWGSSVASMYTSNSEEVDQYVWDHKNFTILFAAGNEGIDSDADGVIDRYSMGSPGSAKNCITVGATENDRPSGSTPTPGYDIPWGTGSWAVKFPSNPINSDHVSDDPDGMAAFSSRGPTLDGRVKPDLVGPGTNIASTRSSLISGDGWGPIDSNYMFMGGTSMATPLVAGTATLVRQYYTDEESITPSAALIKATLVNGTTDIAPGQYGTGSTQEIPYDRPTNVAGWGRVNLENSIFPASPRNMLYEDETTGLNTGQSDTFNYTVSSSAEPLHVTLAWSDYPGSPAAAGGLVNDLDLTITGPGGTYYPNNASQRGASQHLTYDDGVPTNAWSWAAGIRNAVRFTPTSYPATLQTGLFFVGSGSSSYPKTFNWYVYDGNGTSGPSSVLASGSTTIREMGWHPVDLSGEGITISSGDFFLAIELPDNDLIWFYDASSPIDGRSWDYSGGSWSVYTGDDYMFNAILTSAGDSTNQDRVNNLVGIDIASPPTGDYVVTVSGYNVPQGPQPYALVTSGAVARSGANTAPTIADLPDQALPMNDSADNAIDLWAYANDAEDTDADLTFTIDNTPAAGAGVSIDSNRYIDINPTTDWTGQTDVVIRATDSGGLSDTDTFTVDVFEGKVWNGSTSSDWHTASNWTPSGVPTSGDDVVIPDVTNDPIISSGDAAANNLSVNAGAVLDLTDRTLTVEGTLTNDGTLKQTLGVLGGSTSEFLRITNLAGNQTKYYGVDITPSGALDVTPDTVTTWEASHIRQGSSASARQVTLSLDSLSNSSSEKPSDSTAPWAPQAAVNLVLDDGSIEGASGVNNSTNSAQFIWLNRFTPDSGDFPFALDEIWMLFHDFGGAANINVGDAIDLVVYEDADGDPSNGATWLATFNETVQTVYSDTWNVYTLTTPVLLNGPGDVIIAAINRYVTTGVSDIAYPASYDGTSPQSRSWLGWYTTDPPDPATLPPDDTFSLHTSGNYTIRGYGSTVVTNTAPTISGLPDQQVPTNGSANNTIDLWAYASDAEDASSVMTYTIVNSPIVSAGVTIDANRYVDINPATDWTGTTDVEVQVQDTGGLTDTDIFQVTVSDVPDIAVAPASLEETLIVDEVFTTTLTISNTGTTLLSFWFDSIGVSWLSADPLGGGVSAGGSQSVDVVFDATGQSLGDYNTNLVINSNDPDEDPVTVPVTMHVSESSNDPPTISGLPDQTLPVNGSLLIPVDLWTYASDAEDDDSVMIYTIHNSPDPNAGVVISINRYIEINPATDWTGVTDVEIQVQDTGGLTDTDTFQVIVGNIPNISVTPTALEETLVVDEVFTTTLTISNTGATLLSFWFDSIGVSWLSADPLGGGISAGSSQSVDVVFDATGQSPGDYNTNLVINSNDPDDNPVTVPVTMTVVGSGVVTNVTVSVSGNQFCTGRTSGVERCFDIAPAAALDATVRFYLSEAERNGLVLGDLLVFHYDGDWTEEPGPYTSGGTGDAQYVEAQNIDDFSLFALDEEAASGGLIYLPLVMRNYPPLPAIPALNAISNADGDGNYTVSWNAAEWADTYTLQEDDNATFSSPTTRYTGPSTSWDASGQAAGTYYYRVRASNSMGNSGWSNVQSVRVGPPGTPVLNAISNPDGNGSYAVSWNATVGAQTYTLQQDDNAAFSSPTTVYSGPDTSWNAIGNDLGTYYYRVRALNGFGSSAWSNTELVEVTVGITPQDGDWTGTNDQGRSLSFSVSSNGTLIPQFTISVGFDGACGVAYTTNYFYDIPIANNSFTATSSQNEVTGTFTGDTTASGTYEVVVEVYYPSYCTATRTGTWTASTP